MWIPGGGSADSWHHASYEICLGVPASRWTARTPWDIRVTDERFYLRVWREKSLGLGESYMDGWWDCPRIDEMLLRLLRSGVDRDVGGSLRHALREVPWLLFNLQSRARAHMVAERHYDLGNELFFSFLDQYEQYSCAYFSGTDDLDTAQTNKLALIAGKLESLPGGPTAGHRLRVGRAGPLRGRAPRLRGHRRQHLTGAARFRPGVLRGAPGELHQSRDYRSITGSFDKIVSVGMFERVGPRNHEAFMDMAWRCLRDSGIFLLHTIGEQRTPPRSSGSNPWIAKHIFPNGMLPTIAQIAKAARAGF